LWNPSSTEVKFVYEIAGFCTSASTSHCAARRPRLPRLRRTCSGWRRPGTGTSRGST
jgi:hypothetical protein